MNVSSEQSEKAVITIVDVNGRKCAEYSGVLSAGDNYFEIQLATPQTYIMTVQTGKGKQSVKMANSGRAGGNRITPVGGSEHKATVSLRSLSSNGFEPGDEMRYRGYASSRVSQAIVKVQYEDEQIQLVFGVDGQPCLGTPTVTDYDGNVYNTVQIGEQCWMKENLRTIHYADSTPIPYDGGSDYSETNPYYYDYASSNIPLTERGLLYNWPAVMHGASSSAANPSGVQGICPNGWHVPSDAEWSELENYVSSQSQYLCSNNPNYIAKSLAATTGWSSYSGTCYVGNNQSSNNATGFSAVPAGYYNSGGYGYDGSGYFAIFWSATEASSGIALRYLDYTNAYVLSGSNDKYYGYSVRCLRD